MKNSIVQNLIIICCILFFLPLIVLLFLAELGVLWIYLILAIVPTTMLTICIVLYIKKRIIKPINILMTETDNILSGDLSHSIEYKKNDEIGEFISAFDRMRIELYRQQQQQKNFEIDRRNFISSISHDLKTPIASISAYIEALQDGMAATPEEEAHYLKIIENKLTILTELSNQLGLSYAAPNEIVLTLCSANCRIWVSDFLDNVRSDCQIKGIVPDLKNLIDAGNDAEISIDIHQLDRAVQNILSNCFRYTRKFFSISARIHTQTFLLEIANDGVILSADDTEMIFERFYTAEEQNIEGHLGLGLHISRTIIHSMGGEINAQIQSGIITFIITLPII
jgi:signal transduction histidine kinase